MEDEDDIYESFDQANKFKFGVLTGEKIIKAVKAGNVEEVKRLMNLSVDEGGLFLLRLTQKDESGKTAIQLSEEMNEKEIIAILRGEQ
jgi:hypothetical protein